MSKSGWVEKKRFLGKDVAWWAGAALLLLALLLYLWTLDDGLEMRELKGGDLITHQYAQVQGRFSNAPGYPLYTTPWEAGCGSTAGAPSWASKATP